MTTERRRPLWTYVWAAPASLVGLLFAPFFARRRVVDGVLICDGARWPRRLGWRYSAITFGHVVLSLEPPSAELLAHELVHVRQYERLGPLFLPAYVMASGLAWLRGGRAYADNPFERAARSDAHGPR